MTYSWTIEDFTIKSTDGKANGVVCNHCGKSLQFTQPDYSNSPEDATWNPNHTCTSQPTEATAVTASEPIVEDAKTGEVIPPSAPDPFVSGDDTTIEPTA